MRDGCEAAVLEAVVVCGVTECIDEVHVSHSVNRSSSIGDSPANLIPPFVKYCSHGIR
jgi:hypothetical protein